MPRLTGVVQERRRLLREGLALWIAAQDDLQLAGAVASGAELVALCADQSPDFAVFEADAEEWDPLEIARTLRRRHPALRLVGTVGDRGAEQGPALGAGMAALVKRSAGVGAVLAAVRGSGTVVDLRSVERQPRVEPSDLRTILTDRELEILMLIGSGLAAREIADRLRISPKTVDNHKQRIYAKLGVQSQAHAVAVAIRAGFIGTAGL
jgi:DNA-binding NarL/FixJ family response regulator